MKSWNEVKTGMTVYIRNSAEFIESDGLKHCTEPLQKSYIELNLIHGTRGFTLVVIDGGQENGICLYFDHEVSKPEDLLTVDEYNEQI